MSGTNCNCISRSDHKLIIDGKNHDVINSSNRGKSFLLVHDVYDLINYNKFIGLTIANGSVIEYVFPCNILIKVIVFYCHIDSLSIMQQFYRHCSKRFNNRKTFDAITLIPDQYRDMLVLFTKKINYDHVKFPPTSFPLKFIIDAIKRRSSSITIRNTLDLHLVQKYSLITPSDVFYCDNDINVIDQRKFIREIVGGKLILSNQLFIKSNYVLFERYFMKLIVENQYNNGEIKTVLSLIKYLSDRNDEYINQNRMKSLYIETLCKACHDNPNDKKLKAKLQKKISSDVLFCVRFCDPFIIGEFLEEAIKSMDSTGLYICNNFFPEFYHFKCRLIDSNPSSENFNPETALNIVENYTRSHGGYGAAVIFFQFVEYMNIDMTQLMKMNEICAYIWTVTQNNKKR